MVLAQGSSKVRCAFRPSRLTTFGERGHLVTAVRLSHLPLRASAGECEFLLFCGPNSRDGV
eukprot:2578439-Alexandrium_andersonii.AAC.1